MKRVNKQFSNSATIIIFLLAFLLTAASNLNAQIGIGIANPAVSAQLDVSSTTRGFLPPRMTQAQRNAIISPAAGLTVWCNDCGALGELQVYNGILWTNVIGGYAAPPIPATVKIGTQDWTVRNLDVTTYRNGDSIPEVKDPLVWANLTTGAWCNYNNDPALGGIYGKLYNHAAVIDPRGLAPVGWHIPYDSFMLYRGDFMANAGGEWTKLLSYLGSQFYTVEPWVYSYRGITYNGAPEVIPQLKAITLWNSNPTEPNNQSGFTGLPGGQRNADGTFSALGDIGRWWSSGKFTTFVGGIVRNENYYHVSLLIDANSIRIDPVLYSTYFIGPDFEPGHDSPYYVYHAAGNGFSVRCVKD